MSIFFIFQRCGCDCNRPFCLGNFGCFIRFFANWCGPLQSNNQHWKPQRLRYGHCYYWKGILADWSHFGRICHYKNGLQLALDWTFVLFDGIYYFALLLKYDILHTVSIQIFHSLSFHDIRLQHYILSHNLFRETTTLIPRLLSFDNFIFCNFENGRDYFITLIRYF